MVCSCDKMRSSPEVENLESLSLKEQYEARVEAGCSCRQDRVQKQDIDERLKLAAHTAQQ